MSTFIIAEAGVNHNGSKDMALRLVDAAVAARADAVKFQTFRAADIAVAELDKAGYQKDTTDPGESQIDMLRRLELSWESHRDLVDHCRVAGIEFMSTAFDIPCLEFLVNEAGVRRIKIPSGEIDNAPLLLAAARTGLPIILSTGMSTLDDVAMALGVLSIGAQTLGENPRPTASELAAAARGQNGFARLSGHVTLLQCTSAYPTPLDDVNLRAMGTLGERFKLQVGFSDHSQGTVAAVAAVALGATILEKHFTLDRSLPGPDHAASLVPDELAAMVEQVRGVEKALGSFEKGPTGDEVKTREVVRKRLVAARGLKPGEPLDEAAIAIKRAPRGISPLHYWELLGTTAKRAYRADEPFDS